MALDKDKVKLFIADERMLKLMEYAISTGIVGTQKEFLDTIGARAGNAGQLRDGTRGFTVEQILEAAKLTKVNVNWLFGLEKNMLREDKKTSAIDILKSAVMAVDIELRANKRR
jgi:hypothetical protein